TPALCRQGPDLCVLCALCVLSVYCVGIRFVTEPRALVGVIMGSKSDWDAMRQASEMLARFDIPHESKILSAHRTPALTAEYASSAADRGLEVIIAGAGGAAHLAGVVAAHTLVPVIGVP